MKTRIRVELTDFLRKVLGGIQMKNRIRRGLAAMIAAVLMAAAHRLKVHRPLQWGRISSRLR